jgi:hypothetical protein
MKPRNRNQETNRLILLIMLASLSTVLVSFIFFRL